MRHDNASSYCTRTDNCRKRNGDWPAPSHSGPITGNARALYWFLWAVSRAWRKWLNRRDRCRVMLWSRFNRLLKRYPLPWPKIVHSYVKQRTHDLRSPMRRRSSGAIPTHTAGVCLCPPLRRGEQARRLNVLLCFFGDPIAAICDHSPPVAKVCFVRYN